MVSEINNFFCCGILYVLILVVMEDGFGEEPGNLKTFIIMVLILVVMEDGFGDNENKLSVEFLQS